MQLRVTISAAVATGLLVLTGPVSFAATRNAPAHTSAELSTTVAQNLETVVGVSLVNAGKGYALLSNYRSTTGMVSSLELYSTSDGGTWWRRISVVGPSVAWGEGTYDWQDLLVFANASDGLIYLNTRQVLITHDGGHTWRSVIAPGTVIAAVANENNFVLAVGHGCGEAPWSCSTVRLMVLSVNGYAVKKWPDSPVGALQLGTQSLPLLAWTQATLFSSAKPQSWTRRPRPCQPAPSSFDKEVLISSIGGSDLWLVCDEGLEVGDNPKWVYRSMNGGKSWNLMARVDEYDHLRPIGHLQESGRADGLVALSADRAVMVIQGGVWTTSDGGKDWVNSGLSGWPNGGLACSGFDCWAGWAAASTNSATNAILSQPAILRTTNAGRTWRVSVLR